MLLATISSEYSWYGRTAATLPQGMMVAQTIDEAAFYRPWTYARSFVSRFVAVDQATLRSHPDQPGQRIVDLIFYGRWTRTAKVPMLFDCADNRRADVVDAIEAQLRSMQSGGPTRREIAVTARSGAVYAGHIWLSEANAGYTLMLQPLDPDAARPLVYDFDLMDKRRAEDPDDTDLRDLSFVVFDSETTGLNTDTDAVVQLGAVRVVDGRIIASETFNTLVNPGCAIPASATRVHHFDDAMVADAPDFDTARGAFHGFAKGAVIVAHNAPFNMAFLHRGAGVRFENPVLDTVHLSAIVFGGSAERTLNAICDMLGIRIAEVLQHTASGDAMATAQVLVAMLPILEARGLRGFAQVRAEAQKHRHIIRV